MQSNEAVVCKVDDLKNGEMKAYKVNEVDVLVSRIDDEFYAIGAYCTHYGAPLEEGVLHGDRIVCPWHHACFHAKTGDLLEPPALDAQPQYEVNIDGDDVVVKLPQDIESHRIPEMTKKDSDRDRRTFVILGAGSAGNAAAQTLREDGFQGRIVMITHENRGPYDRPNLSKDYLQGEAEPEWMPLRSQDFFEEYGIELWLNKKIVNVNAKDKTITLSNNETIGYDKLLLATGGIPRRLNIPGSDLENIFTLRSFDDSDRIIEASEKASKVAIIGASFIGMETAHSLRHHKLPITVIAPESVPFENVFGREVGKMFQNLQEENGVKFKLGQTAKALEGNGSVGAVMLKNGERIEADLVIVGIGVKPATDFIKGIGEEDDGSFKVNQYFEVSDGVYAAGDIAAFPYWYSDSHIRIEHWRTAEQQGRIAAHNMAGNEIAFRSIPFFWSAQGGINFRYVGHSVAWDDIIITGDISKKDFIAYYVKNDRVHAAAGCGRDREMACIEELMRTKKMPSPDKLKSGSIDLISLLKE